MIRIARLLIALVIANCLAPSQEYSQTVDEIVARFTKRYHTFQGTTLPYYVFKPASPDSQHRFPLVLCLHGSGERGDNVSAVKNNSMATVWARDSNQAARPCFVVVPQCPQNGWWTDLRIEVTIINLLDSLQREFPVDTNRVYITGLSMGGYGTWDLIVLYPHRFAAAIPVCGGGNSSKAAIIEQMPIWGFHGALDYTVPVSGSRLMFEAFAGDGASVVYSNCHNGDCTGLTDSALAAKISAGARLLYTEYQYGGHAIWDQAYNTPRLGPWVFSQARTSVPSAIASEALPAFPSSPRLLQNYPNPFNPTTTIAYSVGGVGDQGSGISNVRLVVYDVLGREVAVLVNERKAPGTYEVRFSAQGGSPPDRGRAGASGGDGRNLASGVYVYRLTAGGFSQARTMVLVK